ncbi:MAG: Uma2 family endonuclease [Xenococcaceae cyanobacterium MO_188.B29]|nr:Uma2 family endonuclease [Xenococcaceae cyanobacterium MO_188.B29]
MKWQEVCESKYLRDLPFKIELNKWGQIVMSPAKIKHSLYQGLIVELLNSLIVDRGFAFPECAIQTSDNVKVADVVWCSEARFNEIEEEFAASIAPEICIEIISASNTLKEMEEKKDLYLEAQAEEVWLCDSEGNIKFYNQQGELSQSLLVPRFPQQVTRKT